MLLELDTAAASGDNARIFLSGKPVSSALTKFVAPDMKKRNLLLIPILAFTLNANAQERTTDPLEPLEPLAQCINSDGFNYESKDRRPVAGPSRIVNPSKGAVQVPAIDGCRLMVYRKSSAPLVNLKIEMSAHEKFADDRQVIIAQMTEMAASSKLPIR